MNKKVIPYLLTMLLCIGSTFAFGQQKIVTGTVTDEKGLALPGATVAEKGTVNTVLTNTTGAFKIKVSAKSTLVISYVGFAAKEILVGNTADFSIKLEAGNSVLNEVVVTSLGISSEKKALGYATATIKSEQLTEAGATNFATAMYGKAPGVQIAASPGGSTSGVRIQIRGANSINFKTTPLIIMDGIPIRDGEFNNSNYWGDQRIRGNGLLDLNNEDIESISVLKGASAAALYGSEANNGVLVITTKSGKGKKGYSIDASMNYFQDQVAYLPEYQNVRGPGDAASATPLGYGTNGFGSKELNGVTYRTPRTYTRTFGEKFDGQPILSWDGVVRPYSFQKNNYASLFQKGNNTTENIAFSNSTDVSNTRVSYTHQHTEGISMGSKNEKHVLNLNSTYKFGKSFSTDILVNFINQDIHNRPYMVDRLLNNFTGMMRTFDNGAWYLNKYQTSRGYRYVQGGNPSLTPDENLVVGGEKTDILDYVWNVNKNITDELSNRIIASITNNYQITNNLKLRGRISTDLTSMNETDKNYSSVPIALTGQYSGGYQMQNNSYNILYGDLLLTYSKTVTKNLDLVAMVGYTADKETSKRSSVGTNGGLTTENRFDLSASYLYPFYSGGSQSSLVKDALVGTLNLNFKNYWYLQGTVRRDRTSTMNPTNNSFVYPSINTGFILSDAFKMPTFIDYAKLRASYGIVGNYPPSYVANVAYSPNNYGNQGGGSVLTSTYNSNPYGNNNIRPEKKQEYEFGFESKLWNNLISLDVSYYHALVVDQLLNLTLPSSSGAGSVLTNIGTLKNTGLEVGVTANLIRGKHFSWTSIVNYSSNKNTVVKLTNGSNQLLHADYDGSAARLVSNVGQAMGDLMAHPEVVDEKGNKVVGSDGLYLIDSKWQKYGNAMPKGIGGFFNSFKYDRFTLDINIDFRIGGDVMPTGLNWLTSRGADKRSLGGMDKAHGGLTYYTDNSLVGHETTASVGPDGETVYNDGILLKGVNQAGATNTHVVPYEYYWNNVFNWGGPQYSESLYHMYIQENSYIKAREITLSYSFPAKIASKLLAKKLQLSAFGRNLFYIYRTIKGMDAEQLTAGSNWTSTVNNIGTNPSTRTFGVMLRASF